MPDHDSLLELFDILRRHHSHELHGVKINSLNDLIKGTKDWNLLVFLELESIFFPYRLDVVKLGLNLGFLLGTINELLDLLSELMELELDKVIEAELW